MSKIKDLSPRDRPREKAYRYGVEKLSDDELLALIISHGAKGLSALEIARKIIDEKINLYGLLQVPYIEFTKHMGLDRVISLKIAASFEIVRRVMSEKYDEEEKFIVVNIEYIYNKYRFLISGLNQEVVILVVLSRCKQIVFEKTLYLGSEDAVKISYREIFKNILMNNGFYFYLIHNHTSGNINPSEKDILLTAELFRRARDLKITFLDHLIVNEHTYFSFANDDSDVRFLFLKENS